MFKTFSKWLKALNDSIQRSQQARAYLWLLTHLTDRELKDIGLTRGDIDRMIWFKEDRQERGGKK